MDQPRSYPIGFNACGRPRTSGFRRTKLLRPLGPSSSLCNRLHLPMREIAFALAASFFVVAVQAQQPPPGGRGRGPVTSPRNAYPERPPADPAALERGKALYGANCAFCHGPDTRGGDSGPSLLRSSAVLDDQHGELIGPILQSGRPDRGMPKFSFSPSQVEDVAAFIHSFKA